MEVATTYRRTQTFHMEEALLMPRDQQANVASVATGDAATIVRHSIQTAHDITGHVNRVRVWKPSG